MAWFPTSRVDGGWGVWSPDEDLTPETVPLDGVAADVTASLADIGEKVSLDLFSIIEEKANQGRHDPAFNFYPPLLLDTVLPGKLKTF